MKTHCHPSLLFQRPLKLSPFLQRIALIGFISLPLAAAVGTAGEMIVDDRMETLADWIHVNGSAPALVASSSSVATAPYMQLANGVVRKALPQTVTGNWTLCFKALHTSYSRALKVGIFNSSGTQGYGVLWNSASTTNFSGQGYVSIQKFTLGAEPAWNTEGTALTPNTASGHDPVPAAPADGAIRAPMACFELSWDAASRTLYLRVNGKPKGQVTDTSYGSFNRIYICGNTYVWLDDIQFLTETPPTAAEIALAINVKAAPYSAKDDGVTLNDSAFSNAITAALNQGKAVYVPPGVYAHSGVIDLRGVTLIGHGYPSILAATTPAYGTVRLRGNGKKIIKCRFTSPNASTRLSTPESSGIHVYAATNFEISGSYVEGSASAGIIAANVPSSYGLIKDTLISNTLADGIHMTCAAHNIAISNNRIRDTGDDAIAVVSYLGNPAWCSSISITGNDVARSSGRGITCVGGSDVTISGNTINRSAWAGILLASEGSYNTYGCQNARVFNNTINDADAGTTKVQGAIFLRGRLGYPVAGATIDSNIISNSHSCGIRILDEVVNAIIRNNQCTGTAKEGIDCQSSCRDLTISGNTLASIGGYGFYCNKTGTSGYLSLRSNQFTNIHTVGTQTYIDAILLSAGCTWSSVAITDNRYNNPGNYLIERYIECHYPTATVTGNTTSTSKPIYVGP